MESPGLFSFELCALFYALMKPFTGDAGLELFINDVAYGTTVLDAADVVLTFDVEDIDVSGTFNLRLEATHAQVVIDNLRWRSTGDDPETITITADANIDSAVLDLSPGPAVDAGTMVDFSTFDETGVYDFLHWIDSEENILSTDADFSMRVFRDLEVTAVYDLDIPHPYDTVPITDVLAADTGETVTTEGYVSSIPAFLPGFFIQDENGNAIYVEDSLPEIAVGNLVVIEATITLFTDNQDGHILKRLSGAELLHNDNITHQIHVETTMSAEAIASAFPDSYARRYALEDLEVIEIDETLGHVILKSDHETYDFRFDKAQYGIGDEEIGTVIPGLTFTVYGLVEGDILLEAVDIGMPLEEVDDAVIHYIDVDGGDAFLIQVGDKDLLIDAGNRYNRNITALLDFLDAHITNGVIEYILPSHPHADHIGGYPAVFENYEVGTIFQYCGSDEVDTVTRGNYEYYVDNHPEDQVHYVCELFDESDIFVYELYQDVFLEFYDTGYLESRESNPASVVFTFEALGTRALFNGDAYVAQEEVYAPLAGDIDILSLGHHGSNTSTSTFLLETVDPSLVIVPVSDVLGNRYGHPHFEVIDRIYQYSNLIPVYAIAGGIDDDNASHQRNGTLTLSIDWEGYMLTSEHYGHNPIELSATDYWRSEENPYRDNTYYYSEATGLTESEALREALHAIMWADVSLVTYGEARYALQETDADPDDPTRVIQLYLRESVPGAWDQGMTWNREHVWPISRMPVGRPSNNDSGMASDLHNLTPADPDENNLRAVKFFNETDDNVSEPDYQPHDDVKGDVARMMFYMAIMYDELSLARGFADPDNHEMGDLDYLIRWHFEDPVSAFERNRNNVIFDYQNNRNPFIDHPEFARIIYQDHPYFND